jgi:hypothetical protein
MPELTPEMKAMMDDLLCEADDLNIKKGGPVLSVLVRHDDGAVSTAFWRPIKKHGLRLPGESDEDCVARHRDLAFKTYEEKG